MWLVINRSKVGSHNWESCVLLIGFVAHINFFGQVAHFFSYTLFVGFGETCP